MRQRALTPNTGKLLRAIALTSGAFAAITLALGPVSSQSAAAASSADTVTETRRAEIRTIEQSMDKIADRGAALFFLARRYAQLGETAKALALLKECMSLDQGFDPGEIVDPAEIPKLQALYGNPQFQALAQEARRKYPPIHHARPAFTVPETDLFPEGLAQDPARQVFYMGTVRQRIVRITAAGLLSDLLKPTPHRVPQMNGIRVDPQDHSLWVATADDQSSELLHVGADGALLAYFSPPGPGAHVLNDLVLRGPRDIYITDTLGNHVYRFDRERQTFENLTLHRPLIYPNGITLSDDGKWLYIADILGVVRLDFAGNASRDLYPGEHNTLAGIDGLYWYKGSLVGVQYGTGPSRVARWPLTPDGLSARSTEVLEYRTPMVSFPTTGAIADGRFYFIENTGIDNYKDGKVVDPQRLDRIRIGVVDLD